MKVPGGSASQVMASMWNHWELLGPDRTMIQLQEPERSGKVREPRHQHGWLGRDLLETPALLTLRLTRLDVFFGVLDLECKGKAQFKEWSPDTESKASNFHRKRSTTSGHGDWSWKSKIELSGKSFSNLTFYGLYVRVQGFKVSFKTMVFFVLPTLKYIPQKIDDEIAD